MLLKFILIYKYVVLKYFYKLLIYIYIFYIYFVMILYKFCILFINMVVMYIVKLKKKEIKNKILFFKVLKCKNKKINLDII